MKKIIVAHEGKQHSYKTAEALRKNGMLYKYITTVYDKPLTLTRVVKHILKGKMKRKASSRRTEELDDKQVLLFFEFWELLLIFGGKFKFLFKLYPNYHQWLCDKFGVKVAKYAIKNGVDVVIMYDTNSNSCFEYLRKYAPHIIRILDVTIANRLFLKDIYINDLKYKNSDLAIEQKRVIDGTYDGRLYQELDNSQYFLAASNFVKNSLLFSGVSEDAIKIVPYGVDVSKFKCKTYNIQFGEPLKIIFMGSCAYRKGLHHLLSVVSKYSEKEVELYIAGDYKSNSPMYTEYKDKSNIHFLGFVTRDILHENIVKCDVFVLPSLAEGLALVTLEAMASGLPIICTPNTGVNDLITEGKEGFVVNYSNCSELKSKIDWYINNKNQISVMGKNAYNLVQNYTWDNYSTNLIDKVNEIIRDHKENIR